MQIHTVPHQLNLNPRHEGPMREMGIRMEGCEEAIESIVKEACAKFDPFRYLEIGVGGGGTLKAVTDIVRENHNNWITVGVDISEGWSLKLEEIKVRIPNIIHGLSSPETNFPHLSLFGSAEFLLCWPTDKSLHVVIIDGCHGKACVMADFLGVEPLVEKGGFVIFHDAGIEEQGVDIQPHCGEPINVRSALIALKLIEDIQPEGAEIPYRDGWSFHSLIQGDTSRGGHSCVVVQKV